MKDMEPGGGMSGGRRAEGFLGLLVAILLLIEKWEDNPSVKLLSIALSAAGLICVFLLRRRLVRPWVEIYTITFAAIALILIFNMLFLS